MHNGMIKVVTGIRRCGKSYLLFNLFSDYLKAQGVVDEHIGQLPKVCNHRIPYKTLPRRKRCSIYEHL